MLSTSFLGGMSVYNIQMEIKNELKIVRAIILMI